MTNLNITPSLEPQKHVQTRDGRKVWIYWGDAYYWHGRIEYLGGQAWHRSNGSANAVEKYITEYDLIEIPQAPEEIEVSCDLWVYQVGNAPKPIVSVGVPISTPDLFARIPFKRKVKKGEGL